MRRTSTSLDAFWPCVFIQGGGVYTGWLAMFAHKSFRLQNVFPATILPLEVDSRNGVVSPGLEISSCPNHYPDIWHLLSADMLSYLAADVEISRPGLLANSTSRNGPNGPALVSQVAGSLVHRSQRVKLLGS